jgi:hypothetical protein
VFRADFSQSSGVERCFLAGSSSELWKWHRKLGHLSFDLLSRLSKLNLVRGLPRWRLEKELVCAPCRHTKMVAYSHPPLIDVMTERPCELLHMDLVGPVKDRLGDQRGGSEWEPIKILLLTENSALTPNSQPRIPTRVCQGHVLTTDVPTLGTNPKRSQSGSTNQEAKDLAILQ